MTAKTTGDKPRRPSALTTVRRSRYDPLSKQLVLVGVTKEHLRRAGRGKTR
jgi:hypothetical protein